MSIFLLLTAVLLAGMAVVFSRDGRGAGVPTGGMGSHVVADLAALLPVPPLAAGWLLGLPFPAAAAEAALWALADPVAVTLAVATAYAFGEDRLPPLYAAAVGLVVACLGRTVMAEVAPWAVDRVTPASAVGGTLAFVAVAALTDLAVWLLHRRRPPPAR